ncbi:MAG: hypothetical protein AAF242_10900 [Bacteroidota bacterium]
MPIINVKQLLNDGKQMLFQPLIEGLLPTIKAQVHRFNLNEEEGGLKKPEEDAVVLLIATAGEDIVLNIHPIIFVEGKPVLQKALLSFSLDEILANGFQIEPMSTQHLMDQEEE